MAHEVWGPQRRQQEEVSCLRAAEQQRRGRLLAQIHELQTRNRSLSGGRAKRRSVSCAVAVPPPAPPIPAAAARSPTERVGGFSAGSQMLALTRRMRAAAGEEARLARLLAAATTPQPERSAPAPAPETAVFTAHASPPTDDAVFRRADGQPPLPQPHAQPAAAATAATVDRLRAELADLSASAQQLRSSVGRSGALVDALLAQHGDELVAVLPNTGVARTAARVLIRQLREQHTRVSAELGSEVGAFAERAAASANSV